MANISALLEIIRTAHLGRDMRQALHDSIRDVNNDTETALGKSLTFTTATRKLSLKAKDGTVLSEAVIPGGGSGGGSVNSVNNVQPDADGNVTVNLADINDVNLNSPTSGQVLKYDGEKWINGSGGGGGTTDYSDLTNKPQINGVTLSGNKTASDLGVASNGDITSIIATGTTNNTGNTITNGQLFYLNGTLCKALSNIASGSAFTLNTNYAVKNLNDELADRPLKYKYVQPRYNSATTAGNTYVINNALSVMGLQSTDKVCGLVLASISGNSSEDGGQAFYISFNDTIEFTPKSGNTSYTILNMVVFYN